MLTLLRRYVYTHKHTHTRAHTHTHTLITSQGYDTLIFYLNNNQIQGARS